MHVDRFSVTLKNQPESERTEQMLGDEPRLTAVTTKEWVVSPTSQIPLKSLLRGVLRSTGTESGSRCCHVTGVGWEMTRFLMISLTSVTL